MTSLHRVILDTDIGSDVDDLMALALILGTPSIDLLGVTTVYGDSLLRARIAAQVMRLAGRRIPIHAGEATPLSGREIWWAGHEGALYDGLDHEAVDSTDAVDFLIDAVLAQPGEIDVVAIGPLTNIAAAIRRSPEFAGAMRHLWIMGGAFTTDEPEHNLRSDVVAAQTVFAAGIATTVTGLEVTRRINIGAPELKRIADSGELGRLVQSEIEQWWKFWDTEWNVPHDPVTVLTLTQPDLFRFSDLGEVTIREGDEDGVSRFVAGPQGRTRITVGLDAEATSAAIVDGIVIGSAASAATGTPR